eukprot:TRINITY_DN846_c0_g1_i1.p1 TRINITY_DN846_c0_g1~~TRINITY_DN846_c0_g1_i1.p1  ORF type:complete len:209 (+),score=42.31 TRINITY_DN846_c0_g1_i1:67-693(+)
MNFNRKENRGKYRKRKWSRWRIFLAKCRAKKRMNLYFLIGVIVYSVFMIFLMINMMYKYELYNAKNKLITYTEVSKESDEEWVKVLRDGEIMDCSLFQPKDEDAISEKHICVVKYKDGDGDTRYYKTLAKLVYTHSFFSFDVYKNKEIDIEEEKDYNVLRRALRVYQGFPEIVTYHVDRVMDLYMKPPFVGRTVTNRVLYGKMITKNS